MKPMSAADLAQARDALRWHFPTPAPDETLYSMCARFHQLSAYRRSSLTGHLLFGTPRASARHCVPFGLGTLLDIASPILEDANAALTRHTVGALYLRFMSDEQRERATFWCSRVPNERIRFAFGWASTAFDRCHPLRACESCMRSDETQYGFAYWHVRHQLPGIRWCARHSRPLLSVSSIASSVWALPRRVPLSGWQPAPNAQRCVEVLAQTITDLCGQSRARSDALRAAVAIQLEQAQVVRAARALDLTAVRRWLEARLLPLAGSCEPMVDGHCNRAADALTGRHVGHPLRWALLITALKLEGAPSEPLVEAANGPSQCELAGFASPTRYEAPARAHGALGAGATWRSASLSTSVSRAVVQRWRTDPGVRLEWQAARLQNVRGDHEAAVLTAAAAGLRTRAQLRLTCAAAVQWFQRNDPDWLDRVFPPTRGAQLPLWRDECN